MIDRKQRVFWRSGSTPIDVSPELNDFRRGTKVMQILLTDQLYVGCEWPFNHKYFDVLAANANASVASVQFWDGSTWNDAVDVIDETATGGKTLAQSGTISWAMDRIGGKSWFREQDSNRISALTGTRIFELYWMRFRFSASLSAATELRYIGERFSDDTDLISFYPDTPNLLTAFASGKTDWREQEFASAEAIARDLRSQAVLYRREQILRSELFNEASVHKTAQIIYSALGIQYEDRMKAAAVAYRAALNFKQFELDRNADAIPDGYESTISTAFQTR